MAEIDTQRAELRPNLISAITVSYNLKMRMELEGDFDQSLGVAKFFGELAEIHEMTKLAAQASMASYNPLPISTVAGRALSARLQAQALLDTMGNTIDPYQEGLTQLVELLEPAASLLKPEAKK